VTLPIFGSNVVVTHDQVQQLMPPKAIGARDAIRHALKGVRATDVATRLSVAGAIPDDPD